MALLLTACDEGGGTKLTVITGHQPAVVGNTIYIPYYVETKGKTNNEIEQGFVDTGEPFKAWTCGGGSDQVIPNGLPIREDSYRVDIHEGSAAEIDKLCGGIACADYHADPCLIMASCEHIPAVWSHEHKHCEVNGSWH